MHNAEADLETESLDLKFHKIGDKGAEELAKTLQSPGCKLTSLNLSSNSIDYEGAVALAATIQLPGCKLTSLDLDFNSVGDKGVMVLAMRLPSCSLTSLNLGFNSIGDAGAEALARAIKSPSCKIQSLALYNNSIGDKGAQEFGKALQDENCTLTSLKLQNNNIGLVGAKELGKALQSKNCKLVVFNLSHNKIGDEGARVLAVAIQTLYCKLSSLDLGGSSIGDEGARELGKALQSASCKLTSLDLCNNNISTEGVQELGKALESSHCQLISLDLSRNCINDKEARAAKALGKALQNANCKLTFLNLHMNKIQKIGRKAIAVGVAKSKLMGREITVCGLGGNFYGLVMETFEKEKVAQEKPKERKHDKISTDSQPSDGFSKPTQQHNHGPIFPSYSKSSSAGSSPAAFFNASSSSSNSLPTSIFSPYTSVMVTESSMRSSGANPPSLSLSPLTDPQPIVAVKSYSEKKEEKASDVVSEQRSITKYSHVFDTIYDEQNELKNTIYIRCGCHYSILRAQISLPKIKPFMWHFAIIWDEDHDIRIIKILEKLYFQNKLQKYIMFSERKGNFTAVLRREIKRNVDSALPEQYPDDGDIWPTTVFTCDNTGHDGCYFIKTDKQEALDYVNSIWEHIRMSSDNHSKQLSNSSGLAKQNFFTNPAQSRHSSPFFANKKPLTQEQLLRIEHNKKLAQDKLKKRKYDEISQAKMI